MREGGGDASAQHGVRSSGGQAAASSTPVGAVSAARPRRDALLATGRRFCTKCGASVAARPAEAMSASAAPPPVEASAPQTGAPPVPVSDRVSEPLATAPASTAETPPRPADNLSRAHAEALFPATPKDRLSRKAPKTNTSRRAGPPVQCLVADRGGDDGASCRRDWLHALPPSQRRGERRSSCCGTWHAATAVVTEGLKRKTAGGNSGALRRSGQAERHGTRCSRCAARHASATPVKPRVIEPQPPAAVRPGAILVVIPRSGTLHCTGSQADFGGMAIFRDLPAARLRFTFDHAARRPVISHAHNGTQMLTLRSTEHASQTRCDAQWKVVE